MFRHRLRRSLRLNPAATALAGCVIDAPVNGHVRQRQLRQMTQLTKSGLLLTGLILIAISTLARPGMGQATTRPAVIVSTEQCAADAAFQKLADAVLDLKLSDGTTVAELWGEVVTAEASVRRGLLRERELGKTRRAADGAIEVDVSIPMPRVEALVREATERFIKNREAGPVAFKPSDRATLTATGRWQGPPPAPAGPIGWRHCDTRQLEQVAAAARVDARQHLLDALGSWQVSASQTLGDVWAVRPDFRQAIERVSDSLLLADPIYESTGLCRCSIRFQRGDIVRLLVTASKACADPIEAELGSAIDPAGVETLEIEGFAVAPPFAPQGRRTDQTTQPATVRPDWADRALSAKVPGRAPEHITDASERLRLATAAATVEAKRRLWLQIEQLQLPSGKTVGALLTADRKSPAIAAINDAFSLELSSVSEGDVVTTITLTIPLEAVWQAMAGLDSPKK